MSICGRLSMVSRYGGHVALAYSATKFYEGNPKAVRAFFAAYEEAVGMIKKGSESRRRHLSFHGEGACHRGRDRAAASAARRHLPGRARPHHGLPRVHGQIGLRQADAEELEGLFLPSAL